MVAATSTTMVHFLSCGLSSFRFCTALAEAALDSKAISRLSCAIDDPCMRLNRHSTPTCLASRRAAVRGPPLRRPSRPRSRPVVLAMSSQDQGVQQQAVQEQASSQASSQELASSQAEQEQASQEQEQASQEQGQASQEQAGSQGARSSLIVRFYRDGAKDSMGRTLEDMLQYDDWDMERCHDHMQWMFPLHEESMFAARYEILTEADVEQLRGSRAAAANMARAAGHFRAFLGIDGAAPAPGKWRWAHNGNHNLLRITRAIRSLRLFGLEQEAQELYNVAMQVAVSQGLSKLTQQYWTRALQDAPMDSLQGGGSGGAVQRGLLERLLASFRNA